VVCRASYHGPAVTNSLRSTARELPMLEMAPPVTAAPRLPDEPADDRLAEYLAS
jgi:hypothetical protein